MNSETCSNLKKAVIAKYTLEGNAVAKNANKDYFA